MRDAPSPTRANRARGRTCARGRHTAGARCGTSEASRTTAQASRNSLTSGGDWRRLQQTTVRGETGGGRDRPSSQHGRTARWSKGSRRGSGAMLARARARARALHRSRAYYPSTIALSVRAEMTACLAPRPFPPEQSSAAAAASHHRLSKNSAMPALLSLMLPKCHIAHLPCASHARRCARARGSPSLAMARRACSAERASRPLHSSKFPPATHPPATCLWLKNATGMLWSASTQEGLEGITIVRMKDQGMLPPIRSE
mmetsp:Transcript_126/g.468  ORF Transcript_126/g.468 Transcript_126/m.468 type:complete len:258 (+) Transcript_126:1785-2558(+)